MLVYLRGRGKERKKESKKERNKQTNKEKLQSFAEKHSNRNILYLCRHEQIRAKVKNVLFLDKGFRFYLFGKDKNDSVGCWCAFLFWCVCIETKVGARYDGQISPLIVLMCLWFARLGQAVTSKFIKYPVTWTAGKLSPFLVLCSLVVCSHSVL